MKRESAFHLVRALRLSSDSPETADELEEFIIDLLETVEFSAVGKSVVRGVTNQLLVNEPNEPQTVTSVRGVPLTDG